MLEHQFIAKLDELTDRTDGKAAYKLARNVKLCWQTYIADLAIGFTKQESIELAIDALKYDCTTTRLSIADQGGYF